MGGYQVLVIIIIHYSNWTGARSEQYPLIRDGEHLDHRYNDGTKSRSSSLLSLIAVTISNT